MMKASNSDPRAARSQAQLKQAMLALVVEKNFADLTIREVTQRARLHRSTFYLHYGDLRELLDDCAREMFSQMRAEIYQNKIQLGQTGPLRFEPFVESVFDHLEKHEAFYRVMLGKSGYPAFRALFQEMLAELIFEPVTFYKASNARIEIFIHFFSAGFTEIAAWWLDNGKPVSVQTASRLIVEDILPDYLRLITAGE